MTFKPDRWLKWFNRVGTFLIDEISVCIHTVGDAALTHFGFART